MHADIAIIKACVSRSLWVRYAVVCRPTNCNADMAPSHATRIPVKISGLALRGPSSDACVFLAGLLAQ